MKVNWVDFIFLWPSLQYCLGDFASLCTFLMQACLCTCTLINRYYLLKNKSFIYFSSRCPTPAFINLVLRGVILGSSRLLWPTVKVNICIFVVVCNSINAHNWHYLRFFFDVDRIRNVKKLHIYSSNFVCSHDAPYMQKFLWMIVE